jgi:hypothetical protein
MRNRQISSSASMARSCNTQIIGKQLKGRSNALDLAYLLDPAALGNAGIAVIAALVFTKETDNSL